MYINNMVFKICIVGIPSVGKTTVFNYMKEIFSTTKHKVKFVEEYARIFINEHGSINNMSEQRYIAQKQQELENNNDADIIVTESPVWTSLAYSNMYFLNTNKDYELYNKLKEECKKYKYDIVIYCNSFGKYINDGVRYQKEEELGKLEYYIRKILHKYNNGDIITLPKSKKARYSMLQCIIKNIEEYK